MANLSISEKIRGGGKCTPFEFAWAHVNQKISEKFTTVNVAVNFTKS